MYSNKTLNLLKISSKSPSFISKLHSVKTIPGPRPFPGFGTLPYYLPIVGPYSFNTILENCRKKYEKYGSIFREEIMPGFSIIWIVNPDDIKAMYLAEGKYPTRRSHLALAKYRMERQHIYKNAGLLATNGPEWQRIRSPIQRFMSRVQNVRKYIQPADQVIQDFIDRRIEENTWKRDVANADFLPELSRVYLELICLVAFDIRLNAFSPSELHPTARSSRLIKAALDTNDCILRTDQGLQLWKKFETPMYKKLKNAQLYMESVALEFVKDKFNAIKNNQSNSSTHSSILEQLLMCNELDYSDVVGFACDMLLAGVDTTSYTTSFLLYSVAINPQIQDKIYNELIDLLPSKTSPITFETMEKSKLTRCVLKESLRLNPISIGVGRIIQNPTVLSGYEIPKESSVVSLNQLACRLNSNFYKADEFIPERWLKSETNTSQVHPYLALPFGHGPRSCIARRLAEQNIHILIIKLLRHYRLEWKGTSLGCISQLINKPSSEIALDFIPR